MHTGGDCGILCQNAEQIGTAAAGGKGGKFLVGNLISFRG